MTAQFYIKTKKNTKCPKNQGKKTLKNDSIYNVINKFEIEPMVDYSPEVKNVYFEHIE